MTDQKKWWQRFAVFGILAAAPLVLAACDSDDEDDSEDEEKQMMSDMNIVEVAQDTATLSTLVDAVVAAQLDGTLDDEDTMYTVFAPTNVAFSNIQDTVDLLLEEENADALEEVLLYHVVSSKVMSSDLEDGQIVQTLNGESIEVTIDGGKVMINGSEVTTADVKASNGVVHIIDEVLIPENLSLSTGPTIVDLAIETSDLSTLVDAVVAAELVDALADETVEYTVFAPTNDAFAAIQETVDKLLLPENQADLQNVLLYHVVDSAVLSGDLTDGQTVTTLSGETLTVTIQDGSVLINDAQVITADVEASNGVVHIIDTVLVP